MSVHVRVPEELRDQIMSLKLEMGFRSAGNVVHYLLLQTQGSIKPATLERVMKRRVPVVITGKPLCGKTYFIRKQLLPKLNPYPVLVIDTWNGYRRIDKVGYEVNALDFGNYKGHIRFVPTKRSDIAEREIERLFEDLDMKRDDLRRWIVIVEEAHAYRNLPPFMKFLYGSRRIVRKMIAVTPDVDAFDGLETLTSYREDVEI